MSIRVKDLRELTEDYSQHHPIKIINKTKTCGSTNDVAQLNNEFKLYDKKNHSHYLETGEKEMGRGWPKKSKEGGVWQEISSSTQRPNNTVSAISVITSFDNGNLPNKKPQHSFKQHLKNKTVSGELETDRSVLERRQKQILYRKSDPAYKNYISNVPKDTRNEKLPSTPDKNLVYSRREFDGLVKHWKRQVHNWHNNRNILAKRPSISVQEPKSQLSITSILSEPLSKWLILENDNDLKEAFLAIQTLSSSIQKYRHLKADKTDGDNIPEKEGNLIDSYCRCKKQNGHFVDRLSNMEKDSSRLHKKVEKQKKKIQKLKSKIANKQVKYKNLDCQIEELQRENSGLKIDANSQRKWSKANNKVDGKNSKNEDIKNTNELKEIHYKSDNPTLLCKTSAVIGTPSKLQKPSVAADSCHISKQILQNQVNLILNKLRCCSEKSENLSEDRKRKYVDFSDSVEMKRRACSCPSSEYSPTGQQQISQTSNFDDSNCNIDAGSTKFTNDTNISGIYDPCTGNSEESNKRKQNFSELRTRWYVEDLNSQEARLAQQIMYLNTNFAYKQLNQ